MTTKCSAFDQAILDAAFNNRAHVPDHQSYFDRWTAQSEQARRLIGGQFDIAYGPGPRQKLDFFPALHQGAHAGPLMIFIHGGYWQSLDQKMFAFLAPRFVEDGINFAAVTYDLCPAVSVAEIGRQVRASVVFLHNNAQRLGFDARRMFVSGHSAGGHLSALLAGTDWTGHGLPADALKAAVPVSGLYDLEPIRRSYLNQNLRMDASMAAAESPLLHMPKRAPPLLLVCGAAELPEFPRQQRQFAAAWRQAGLAADELELPGCHHFSILDGIISESGLAWRRVRSLIGG